MAAHRRFSWHEPAALAPRISAARNAAARAAAEYPTEHAAAGIAPAAGGRSAAGARYAAADTGVNL